MTVEISRFGPDGPVGGVEGTDLQWWKLGDDEAAVAVTATLKLLQQSQRARLDEYELSMRLYGGGLPTANARRQAAPAQKETASFNIVWSALSTAEAMLARNKPKAMFLTSGGNYHQRRKAKKLNRFVDGVFYECKANERRREARRDGLVFGDGPTKVLEGPDGRVRFERVLPEELFIDDLEGIYGQPRQMHHVKVVDRNELREIFKDRASVLKGNGGAVLDVDGIKARVSDMVTVRESWHLPSAPGAKDGKHIITIDGHALTAMEEWPHPFFPFARWRWAPRLKGFWSQGAAEQLRNLQIEIQKIDRTIARSIQLAGSFKVLLPIGSDIPQEHINNAIGTVVKHRPGFEPKYITPPIVQPEIYERRRELIRDAFNQIGISQMNATAQKPPGIDSGKGQIGRAHV